MKQATQKRFPADPFGPAHLAVGAVFESWNGQGQSSTDKRTRSQTRWEQQSIFRPWYSETGPNSGTGVCFTRNPSTGEPTLFGEFLINAQGEDVVAGIRTPEPISELNREMPTAYQQLLDLCRLLERHFKDMQDIEFTIEEGKLYILQTRSGKRTAASAIRIAVDMVKEGLLTKEESVLRVLPAHLEQLVHRQIDPTYQTNPIATGLPASPGAATGRVIFDTDEAHRLGADGESVILVREETTPEDIHGMIAAKGVLTSRGGMTSHAAVVARGMGKPAVVGCEQIKIDPSSTSFSSGQNTVKKNDVITIDGTTGNVLLGVVPTVEPKLGSSAQQLLGWADEIRSARR